MLWIPLLSLVIGGMVAALFIFLAPLIRRGVRSVARYTQHQLTDPLDQPDAASSGQEKSTSDPLDEMDEWFYKEMEE